MVPRCHGSLSFITFPRSLQVGPLVLCPAADAPIRSTVTRNKRRQLTHAPHPLSLLLATPSLRIDQAIADTVFQPL